MLAIRAVSGNIGQGADTPAVRLGRVRPWSGRGEGGQGHSQVTCWRMSGWAWAREMTVKSFRLYLGAGKEATGTGCLLACLSAVVMVGLGVPLAFWVGSLTGIIFVAVAVGVGMTLFALGAVLLAALGIPLSRDQADGGQQD